MEEKENEDDIIKYKCKVLIEYKNLISNLEVINEYIGILRSKGICLQIKITIEISLNEKKRATKNRIFARKRKKKRILRN